MCKAASESRTPYLKAESFRLLSSVVPTVADDDGGQKEVGPETAWVQKAFAGFILALKTSLQDDEMKKAKRLRDILKTADKWVQFGTKHVSLDPQSVEDINEIVELLNEVGGASESDLVKQGCKDLVSHLEEFLKAATKTESTTASSSKKAKKGKKKKKGKKR